MTMEFTKREYQQFYHGISMSLLSKKSAQKWRYDDETAEEIRFLEGLESKVLDKIRQADTSQTEREDESQTCSVNGRPYSECSDCEHFRCTADEPQTETSTNNSIISEKLQLKDEPQTEYSIGYYTPTNAEILKALEDEPSGKE